MPNKAPAFQFYPSDFLSDENVALMSNQEVGCYIKLLCYCWKEGSIPKEVCKIGKLCGEPSAEMEKMWPNIRPCFNLNGERYFHRRLEVERQKQKTWREKSVLGGKHSANNRAQLFKGGSTARLKGGSSLQSSSSSSTSVNTKNLYVEGDNPLRLSRHLFSKIQTNNPQAKEPNLQVWAKQVDLMLRVDSRTPDDIQAVIDWCQQDEFWKVNILSTGKLREKFDQLYVKMIGGRHGPTGSTSPVNPKARRIEPDNFAGKQYVGSDLDKLPWNQEPDVS